MTQPQSDQAARGRPSAADGGSGQSGVSRRQKAISLGIAGALLASLVVGIVVFAGADDSSAGVETADGIVVDADEDRLLFRPDEPVDGESQIELTVLPEDRSEELDPEHLLYHASTGGAIRLFYERDGESYIVRRAHDLPGLR